MKISISGKELPSERLAALEEAVARMQAHPDRPHYLFDFKSARKLSACKNEQDYLDTFIDLLHWRAGVGTEEFRIPGRRGPFGRLMTMIRKQLWRIMRYQHDRMAQQQNPVNWNTLTALKMLREEQIRQDAAYQTRIRDLEERLAGLELSDED